MGGKKDSYVPKCFLPAKWSHVSPESACENEEKAITNEKKEEVTSANQEKATSVNLVKEAATANKGRRQRSGCFDISQDSPSSVVDDEEGTGENFTEEVFLDCPRSFESVTDSSKASTSSESTEAQHRTTSAFWPGIFGFWKRGPAFKFPSIISLKSVPVSVPNLTRRKTKRIKESKIPLFHSALAEADPSYFKSSWKNFALSELKAATNDFSVENLIGQGGYAEVYKGKLEDGQFVAIKRLTRGSPEEMTMDFLSELGMIVHVDHPNIAKMIGYGVEGGLHLVLELSPHGSLSSLLYGPREKLNWDVRYNIALGTAEGLSYLHEGCQRRIIHKDIKAANVLLTEDFGAQISDFGLSKWLPDHWTHHIVSQVEGTFGYLPPEYFMHGIVDEKTDVYAYGVLLLELITGRQAIDSSQKSLVMWAKPLMKKNSIKELVDPIIGDAYDSEKLTRLISVASVCVSQSSTCRPQMSQVVQILKGDDNLLQQFIEQNQDNLLIPHMAASEELLDVEEYNSSECSDDLNRYREIVFRDNAEEYNSSECSDDLNQNREIVFQANVNV